MAKNDETTEVTEDEVAALRAENEELRAQLEVHEAKGPLWRRVVAVVLAILALIAVVAAVDAVWLKTTLSDEDRFVSTLQPLPKNDAVATALSVRVAEGVVEAAGVEVWLTETLPSGLAFVAPPLTESIEGLVADAANDVVQSDAVTTVWTATLRLTHKGVSAVLSGNDRALVAEDGRVAVDLDAIAAVVIDEVEARGLDLPDLEIELGEIVIYESDELAAAQAVAQAIDTAGWFLPLVAILLIAGAVFTAPNRRWMTAFLGFGVAIVLLLDLAVIRISRNAILGTIDDETTRAAAEAVWDTVLLRLRQGTWALIVLAFIIGLIAWLLGPSRRARSLRSWGGETVDHWRRPVDEEPSGFTAFMMEWRRTIQWAIVVVGLVFLIFGPDPTPWTVILTAVVVLALALLVEVLAGPTQPTSTEVASAPEMEDAET